MVKKNGEMIANENFVFQDTHTLDYEVKFNHPMMATDAVFKNKKMLDESSILNNIMQIQ